MSRTAYDCGDDEVDEQRETYYEHREKASVYRGALWSGCSVEKHSSKAGRGDERPIFPNQLCRR